MRKIKCIVCSEIFEISDEAYTVFRRSLQTFYCPFGHAQHFTEHKRDSAEIINLSVIDGGKDDAA